VGCDLSVIELRGIELSGAGSIEAGPVDTDHLRIDVIGAGQVRLRSLRAEDLVVRHSGVGQCEVSGDVVQQDVRLSGAGEYAAADLQSQRADIGLSGVGSATVWATDQLAVEITGAGALYYYGTPEVSQQVSGLGTVRARGEP
jgi:hypothetical protein